MAQKVGRREKLAQKVGRREIYPPVPPPSFRHKQSRNFKVALILFLQIFGKALHVCMLT